MKRALKRSRPEASRARREKASGKRGAEINMPDPHLAYWAKELAGAPMYLELPTDRPRSSAQNSRMATYRFALPTSLALSLRNLSRCEQTTVFMTLVAGFTVLLHRYTGQDDILAGSPMFGGEVRGRRGMGERVDQHRSPACAVYTGPDIARIAQTDTANHVGGIRSSPFGVPAPAGRTADPPCGEPPSDIPGYVSIRILARA